MVLQFLYFLDVPCTSEPQNSGIFVSWKFNPLFLENCSLGPGLDAPVVKQGPDLRYLRRAIWKGRALLNSGILAQSINQLYFNDI